MNVEEILRKAAAEIRAANINGWGNACEAGADRIRELEAQLERCRTANVYDGNVHKRVSELEAALRKIVAADWDGMRDTDEVMQEIARTALETKGESNGTV